MRRRLIWTPIKRRLKAFFSTKSRKLLKKRTECKFYTKTKLKPNLGMTRSSRRSRWRPGAWCTAREAMRLGTKPECTLESVAKQAWYTSPLRIRIDDRRRRIGLVFWVQRAQTWNKAETKPAASGGRFSPFQRFPFGTFEFLC